MYKEKLRVLSGVQHELEISNREKNSLQVSLSSLEEKYRVMETQRDSQQRELDSLKVRHRVKLNHVSRVKAHHFSCLPLCSTCR